MKTQTPDRRLLRVAEAAEVLGISRSRAYVMAQRGELPGQMKIGNTVRIDQRALDLWIDRQVSGGA
jgi:excisionase family DNA binding protein